MKCKQTRVAMCLPGGVLCWPFQKLGRLNVELVGKATNDFDADVVRALFQLTQIAPADLGLERKFVLGPSPLIAQTAQISGKCLPQIHAGQKAVCPTYCTSIYFTKRRLMHILNRNCVRLLHMRQVIQRK